jgi:hypothetical protein
MQDVTVNPGRKPAASVGLYLPNRILHLFKQSDSETDSKERFRLAQVALDFVRPARKQTGESPWWALGFAVGCASLLIAGIFYALQPEDFYQVTERQSGLNQTIQQVHRGKVLAPSVMFFCEPQPFEAGHTLTSFKFYYHPDQLCYSVSAFSLLRDSSTCPKVPANCWHTDCANPMTDHILCEGKPKF